MVWSAGEGCGVLREGCRRLSEAEGWCRSDGWVKCSTACWYGISASVNKRELVAAVAAAIVGKGVLSLIVSRVPEVIDEPMLQRFLPPESFMRVGLPWATCGW